jgi:DNA polymerase sigma
MSPDQKAVLTRICTEVMFDLQPSKEELRHREYILKDLSRYISKTYPTARLGSLCSAIFFTFLAKSFTPAPWCSGHRISLKS